MMPTVRLAREIDFEGWRMAARALRSAKVAPDQVSWSIGGDLCGFEEPATAGVEQAGAFAVPRAFVDLAKAVICHRHPSRFGLLYRLLYRLREGPELLEMFTDPDVSEARSLARQVDQAGHRMKAFVRFREVRHEQGLAHVAWYEPLHRVLERTVPFFAKRFADQRFSILTPDACAHWDGSAIIFAPGADRGRAPGGDDLEAFWPTDYASIFRPARAARAEAFEPFVEDLTQACERATV